MTFSYNKYTLKSPNFDFGMFWKLESFSHGSIVEHFKQDSDNFVTINVISKCANLLITIPCLGERHFHTLNTLTKVRILISKCFGNLTFSHGYP